VGVQKQLQLTPCEESPTLGTPRGELFASLLVSALGFGAGAPQVSRRGQSTHWGGSLRRNPRFHGDLYSALV
jgi:hypothetical protein